MRRRILPLVLVSVLALVAGCQSNPQSGSGVLGCRGRPRGRLRGVCGVRRADELGPHPGRARAGAGTRLRLGAGPAGRSGHRRPLLRRPPRRKPLTSCATCTWRAWRSGRRTSSTRPRSRPPPRPWPGRTPPTGAAIPPVIGVDQEGGLVAHLDGVATTFPPFQEAGDAIAAGPRQGETVVRNAAASTAMELRMLGFTWVFAPVADVTIGAADPTIGSRSAVAGPEDGRRRDRRRRARVRRGRAGVDGQALPGPRLGDRGQPRGAARS